MLLSLALLITAPFGALAAPQGEVLDARGVDRRPDWAKHWNGRCTFTRSATKTVTSTRKVTKYPRPTTTTIFVVRTSSTTITLPQVTSVFSTTSTLYATTTATQSTTTTETATETITNDVPPPTSVIGAPADFTPIRSVYPTGPLKRDLKLEARGRGQDDRKCIKPGEMKCRSTIYTTMTRRTKTRYATSTATARRHTVTKKRTTTITTTVSVPRGPASTTSSFSTTVTIGETITNTQIQSTTVTTTTEVVSGPTPTAYAACGPNNILDSHSGGYIDILFFGPPGGTVFLGSQASPYDCCVACLNNPNCAGAGYLAGTCIGLTPDASCSANLASGQFGAGSPNNAGWTVSNSGCGQWSFAAF